MIPSILSAYRTQVLQKIGNKGVSTNTQNGKGVQEFSRTYGMSSAKTSPMQYTPAAPQNPGQKLSWTCLAASIRSPSMLYSLTNSLIHVSYVLMTSGSSVSTSMSARDVSPSQQNSAEVAFE